MRDRATIEFRVPKAAGTEQVNVTHTHFGTTLWQGFRRRPLTALLLLISLYPVSFFVSHAAAACLLLAHAFSQRPPARWLQARRLGLVAAAARWITGAYWLGVLALVVAFTRFVLVPFWFVGLPIFALALVLRWSRRISFPDFLLLVFDLCLLLAVLLFNVRCSDFLLSRFEGAPYLRPVLATRERTLLCDGASYAVPCAPVWLRKINLYRHDSLLCATNGHEFLCDPDRNVAGLVLSMGASGQELRWFHETYCHDLIYDENASRYFVSRHNQSEILKLDEDLRTVDRVRLPDRIVDLFLTTPKTGKPQLLALSFLGGRLYTLDPESFRIVSCHTYSRYIQNYNFSVFNPRSNKLYASVIDLPHIAIKIDPEDPSRSRSGVWGLGSWGIDSEPDGRVLYVTDFFLGRIYQVDESSMRPLRQRYLKPGIRSVVFDSSRDLVYVGDYYLKDVFVLDRELNRVGTLRSNGRVTLMRISHDFKTLYTVGWRGVYAIDLDAALADCEVRAGRPPR